VTLGVDRQIVYQPRSRVLLTAGRGEKNARGMIKGELRIEPRRCAAADFRDARIFGEFESDISLFPTVLCFP